MVKCPECMKYELENHDELKYWCIYCNAYFFKNEIHASQPEKAEIENGKGESMAGKMPTYRLVVGKATVGVLWDAKSKGGLDYFSGNLDVTALKRVLKDATVKKQQVRVNRAGDTEEHDTIRVAMFTAMKTGSSGVSL